MKSESIYFKRGFNVRGGDIKMKTSRKRSAIEKSLNPLIETEECQMKWSKIYTRITVVDVR